ncbi:hypothetical protein L0337_18435 [candidate division KSB1 bacterium]|nr:hypothetical protein [candidate division KSB1 bacterium]
MKKLNNKQLEAISSAFSNLGNILFLGIAVASVAVFGVSKVPIDRLILSVFGWLICQIASVWIFWILSFWSEEDGID